MSVKIPCSSAAERYDTALRRSRYRPLLPGSPMPQPTATWPAENVALLERYRTWLMDGGLSRNCIEQIHVPMAGHVLGLNLRPHPELNLESDLERAMDYIRSKQLSAVWTKNCGHALNRFRRFLQQERGLIEISFDQVDLTCYQTGLPDWLVQQLARYQRTLQGNWRPARLNAQIRRFWGGHIRLWRWLFGHYQISELTDIKRHHVFDYMDHRIAAGYAPSGINQDLRYFHAFLRFLQEQDYRVPEALLRIRGLKEPDRLPRFLTDEQVSRLRADLEGRVEQARTATRKRDCLIDRAAFYLLWQGGMRLGEVEELRLEDLDLPNRRLMVRRGKGQRDRTVYLTDVAAMAVQEYLGVRGSGRTDHLFLYRTRPLRKDFVRGRIKAAGERAGVKVTPHQLRHTYATQLVNAGCRITSIQQLLGHRHINTTLVYARVHDGTVADDYYAAMGVIEKRLEPVVNSTPVQTITSERANQAQRVGDCTYLLSLLDTLQDGASHRSQAETFLTLREGILALARQDETRPDRVALNC
jgi:integrase/recombinase XerD